MKLKKVFSILLALIMVLSIKVIAFAEEPFKIGIGFVEGQRGQIVEVPVSFKNVPSSKIMGAVLVIKYDPTYFSIDAASILPGELIQMPAEDFTVAVDNTNGIITLWFTDESTGDRLISQAGVFARLKFKINESTPVGVYPITFSGNRGITDGYSNEIGSSVLMECGAITVKEPTEPAKILSAYLDTDITTIRINAIIQDNIIKLNVPKEVTKLTNGSIVLSKPIYSARFISGSIDKTLYNLDSTTLTQKLLAYFGNNTPKEQLLSYDGASLILTDYDGNVSQYYFIIKELQQEIAGTVNLYATSPMIIDGDTGEFEVGINNVTTAAIGVANFKLLYDPYMFTILSVENAGSAEKIEYNINGTGMINILAENINTNGALAKIRFKVREAGTQESFNVGLFGIFLGPDYEFVANDLRLFEVNYNKGFIDVYRYGDLNKDGKVDALDLLGIKQHILYIKQPNEIFTYQLSFNCADVNKDNRVSAIDYLAIKQYILRIRNMLPVVR